MGHQVIRHLARYGDLPDHGILAGQAVDSALQDLYGRGGGVYNDLDIFRQCPGDSAKSERKANKTAFRCEPRWTTPSICEEGGYETMAVTLSDTYGIASVTRTEMLNFVNCYMASGRYAERLTTELVVGGFDINSTRVGVDLTTGKLYWDSHYEEFLRSRQLKIVLMHTPWHTFIRALKKSRELPDVFFDTEEAAMTCTAFAQSKYYQVLIGERNTVGLFGKALYEKALANHSALAPYFSLDKVVLRKKTARSSWEEVSPSKSETKNGDAELWKMTPRQLVDPALQGQVDKLARASMFFTSKLVAEHRRKKKNSVYVKLEAVMSARREANPRPRQKDFVLWCAENFGTGYVEGQALPAVAEKVAVFLRKHQGFCRVMIGLTLAQQATLVEQIKSCCRSFAMTKNQEDIEQFYGVLEKEATTRADFGSPEAMTAVLSRAWERDFEPFKISPLCLPHLPDEFSNYQVKELLSALELKREGSDMSHCVGGYAYSVSNGYSRILQIRGGPSKDTWSTAELRVKVQKENGDVTVKVIQHRGRRNGSPSKTNEEILNFVVSFLEMPEPVKNRVEKGTFVDWASSRIQRLQRVESTVAQRSGSATATQQRDARYGWVARQRYRLRAWMLSVLTIEQHRPLRETAGEPQRESQINSRVPEFFF